jgi:hypothetical protein
MVTKAQRQAEASHHLQEHIVAANKITHLVGGQEITGLMHHRLIFLLFLMVFTIYKDIFFP